MNEYRTPRELQAQAEQAARIRAVLDQAVRDGTSCKVAIALDEPAEVVERWVDAIWNGLRDALSDNHPDRAGMRQEDRLLAIVLLLDERMNAGAEAVLRGLRDGEPGA